MLGINFGKMNSLLVNYLVSCNCCFRQQKWKEKRKVKGVILPVQVELLIQRNHRKNQKEIQQVISLLAS